MSSLEEIIRQKAGEFQARKISTPTKEEQHLVLHWTNGQGFALDFNLTQGLRSASLVSLRGVLDECEKEFRRRGVASRT